MRVVILQHVGFEGPGLIGPWLARRGHEAVLMRMDHGAPGQLPPHDGLVVLGGPMGAKDEADHRWLVSEKRWIREAIETGKPVLGICLGAQLIAASLGARVFPNPEPEIGWFPIYPVENSGSGGGPGASLLPAIPPGLPVLHWHGDTFDLPAGARHLASSAACRHQAFQVGGRVLGLQFHLESTPADLDALVRNGAADLIPSRWVSPPGEIVAVPEATWVGTHQVMDRVLQNLFGQA